jgi:hypothetical protein
LVEKYHFHYNLYILINKRLEQNKLEKFVDYLEKFYFNDNSRFKKKT